MQEISDSLKSLKNDQLKQKRKNYSINTEYSDDDTDTTPLSRYDEEDIERYSENLRSSTKHHKKHGEKEISIDEENLTNEDLHKMIDDLLQDKKSDTPHIGIDPNKSFFEIPPLNQEPWLSNTQRQDGIPWTREEKEYQNTKGRYNPSFLKEKQMREDILDNNLDYQFLRIVSGKLMYEPEVLIAEDSNMETRLRESYFRKQQEKMLESSNNITKLEELEMVLDRRQLSLKNKIEICKSSILVMRRKAQSVISHTRKILSVDSDLSKAKALNTIFESDDNDYSNIVNYQSILKSLIQILTLYRSKLNASSVLLKDDAMPLISSEYISDIIEALKVIKWNIIKSNIIELKSLSSLLDTVDSYRFTDKSNEQNISSILYSITLLILGEDRKRDILSLKGSSIIVELKRQIDSILLDLKSFGFKTKREVDDYSDTEVLLLDRSQGRFIWDILDLFNRDAITIMEDVSDIYFDILLNQLYYTEDERLREDWFIKKNRLLFQQKFMMNLHLYRFVTRDPFYENVNSDLIINSIGLKETTMAPYSEVQKYKSLSLYQIIYKQKEDELKSLQKDVSKFEEQSQNIKDKIVSIQSNKLKNLDYPYIQSQSYAENPLNTGRFKYNAILTSGILSALETIKNFVPNLKNVPQKVLQHNEDIRQAFGRLVASEISMSDEINPKGPKTSNSISIRKTERINAVDALRKYKVKKSASSPWSIEKPTYKFYV